MTLFSNELLPSFGHKKPAWLAGYGIAEQAIDLSCKKAKPKAATEPAFAHLIGLSEYPIGLSSLRSRQFLQGLCQAESELLQAPAELLFQPVLPWYQLLPG